MTHVDSPAPTLFELCRGVGMFGEAVKLVFPAARTLCSAEWESYANAAQLARMADASLECHPVWIGDIAGLDARHLLGLVDLLAAGLPCQPYSCAGKRMGNQDHRSHGQTGDGPIPHFLRIVGECRPAVVFLENVAAWVRSTDQWFRPVGDELCRMGYTLVEPVFLAASDVGASHERERVFLLAVATEQRERWQQLSESARRLGQGDLDWGGEQLGNALHAIERRQESESDGRGQRAGTGNPGGPMAHAENKRGNRSGSARRRRTGLADESGIVAHARGHLQGRQHEPRRNSQGRIPPQRHGCQVDDPASARRDGTRQRPATDEQSGQRLPRPRCPDVAQPARGGQRELRQPSGGDRQPHRRERQLADAQESRRQGPESARRIRPDGCPAEHGGEFPKSAIGNPQSEIIFAPGPSDHAGWQRVVADGSYDQLAPAVEPGLRVLVDGLALVVDAARADQLRCSGNGVVALQAAVALVELLRRAGELTP